MPDAMDVHRSPSEAFRVLQTHMAVGLTLALALLATGCEPPSQHTTGSLAIPIARLQTSAAATLSGVVRAPVGMQPEARGLRVTAIEEAPLAGVTVFLADLAGTPLPDIQPAVTDEAGRYRFAGVPVGRTLMVLVKLQAPDGSPVRLMTLVTTRAAELSADVSAGTTVLAAATLRRSGTSDTEIDPIMFLEAASLLDQVLTASDAVRLEDADLLATGSVALEDQSCDLQVAVEQVLRAGASVNCGPIPTPTPSPSRGSGGGGRGGGGSAVTPTTGGLQTDITIQDGPIMAITPTPTPTSTP